MPSHNQLIYKGAVYKREATARPSTYNLINRMRTILFYMFHGKRCSHCGKKFSYDDIKKAYITMDHKDGNRLNNGEKNQRWMHPACHKSMTLTQRMDHMVKCRKLVQQGKRKPGKSKCVMRATPWGG